METPPDQPTSEVNAMRFGGMPVFDPVKHREPYAWEPVNETANLLVHINHIRRDLALLLNLRAEREDEEERALLLKHAIVELCSLIERMDRLQSLVFEGLHDDRKQTGVGLSAEDKDLARDLFKRFSTERKRIGSAVTAIRNDIGAHRDMKPWKEIMRHWDDLRGRPEMFNPILESIWNCMDFVQKLDIFHWARRAPNGTLHLIQFRFRPGDLEVTD